MVAQRPQLVGRVVAIRAAVWLCRPGSSWTARRSRIARRACRTFMRSYAALAALQRASTRSISCRSATRISAGSRSSSAGRCSGSTLSAPPALLYSDHLDGQDGEAMFRHACAMGLEGIVSKRVDSRYKSGRCLSWVKVRNPDYERR